MTTRIALLRAINVGGTKKLPMADLCALFEGLGFDDARTILQTGNVIFSGGAEPAALEATLEAEAARRLGLETDILVRTKREWSAMIGANPFPAQAERDPARLAVMAVKDGVPAERVEALRAAIRGRENVEAVGRTLYAVYPDGMGRSKLTTALIERTLVTRGTARNWNTVLKIAAVATQQDAS